MGAELLARARTRAASLRTAHRADGHWSAEPLDLVADAAAVAGASVALITRDQRLTYDELDARVDAAAAGLAEAGVDADAAVLIVAENSVASVVACHAVLRLDAVLVLAAANAGRAQVEQMLTECGAVVGIAPAAWLADDAVAGTRWIASTDLSLASAGARRAPARPADEPAIVLYTSGTTARPKGVIHSMSTLHKSAQNYIDAAFVAGDRTLMISPLASVTGVLQALFVGPMLRSSVTLEDRFDPARTFDLLHAEQCTWYGGPDLLLDRLLDAAAGRAIPLRAVILGGTMLDRNVVDRVEGDGIVVIRAYGSSEVPVSTSGLRTDPVAVRHNDDGAPLADVELRIGSDLDPGECCIRGPHAFLGYTSPHDDAHAFEEGWFHTGDVAEPHGDGHIRITGRLRDVVIRNGLKIPITEVEEATAKLPGVVRCSGFVVPDPATGEHLALAIRVSDGAVLELGARAEQLLAVGLAKYKLPEELVRWDEDFPLNPTGKVDRKRLAVESAHRSREQVARLQS